MNIDALFHGMDAEIGVVHDFFIIGNELHRLHVHGIGELERNLEYDEPFFVIGRDDD